ncbi:MAG TPA: tripartite tricarboxylate transporter substrate binding protein [Xanthobacteraceae bacterium]|jgi:tripartite-type tricarboxylate transporter receptor subunit TctC
MHRRYRPASIAALLVLAALVVPRLAAAADKYPLHPITLIVPFPAGGGVDAVARIVADKLAAGLGQPFVIDNRGGAAGVIGMRMAAKGAPDGYTLVLAHTGSTSINPSLYANPGYDPRADFAPIGLIASTPVVLMAHPSFPAKSIADLIAMAKKEPGKINFGTPPPGTGGYLAAELFKSMSGADMTIIPYKGTAALTTDLLGGHVPIGFNVIAPAMGSLQSGGLRAIATAGPTRSGLFPAVPTVDESGLPGFEAVLHYGLLAPAGTPKDIIARLNKELLTLVASPDVRERIAAEGGDPLPSSPEQYAADIDREEAKWSVLIKKLNLKVE